jgi:hypothetical protein
LVEPAARYTTRFVARFGTARIALSEQVAKARAGADGYREGQVWGMKTRSGGWA